MTYILYEDEITEALMQYLVKTKGADYNELTQARFRINIQGAPIDKNVAGGKLVVVEADFACAKVIIEV